METNRIIVVNKNNKLTEEERQNVIAQERVRIAAGTYKKVWLNFKAEPTLIAVKPTDTAADRFRNTIRQIAADMERRGF